MFALVKLKYRMRQLTAAQVWAYVDKGTITPYQAVMICGARPVM